MVSKITKNKAILNRKFLLGLFLIAFILFTLWTLLGKSPYAFQRPLSWNGILAITVFGILVGLTLYLSFSRMKRLVSDFKLTRYGNNLYINDKPLSHSNGRQPIVVIQDVASSGGVGGSHTVGISIGEKFWGLCYELDKVDAKKAAKYLSENLGLEIEERESAAFPLFKLH